VVVLVASDGGEATFDVGRHGCQPAADFVAVGGVADERAAAAGVGVVQTFVDDLARLLGLVVAVERGPVVGRARGVELLAREAIVGVVLVGRRFVGGEAGGAVVL